MTIAAGTRFGTYEITGPLGAGGMGEVYRARDTRLKRDVAIKVLPPSFASDAERLARFQREAETLAALNHPNIAQIYGIERNASAEASTTALAMELVEGPTLADRIVQGPVPTEEALGIAMQIAEALEAAHAKGIVHRDLKPANVKLTPDGVVKVLDFGIAKVAEPSAAGGGRSPTLLTPALTESGVLLGTAAYVAPEQARGRAVDHRADIWAFGCVLYEMLTGRSAFGDEDVTTTLARVLERDANLDALPASVSPAVRRTLDLCLQKDRKERIRDIGDVKLALRGRFESAQTEVHGHGPATRPVWRRLAPMSAALVVGALAGAALLSTRDGPRAPAAVTRFEVAIPEGQRLEPADTSLAISPDGRQIAYVSLNRGVYVRALDDLEPRLIPATAPESAWNPFFSPDGRSIGYWEPNAQQLKRVDVAGGAATAIAKVDLPPDGPSWADDGTILFGAPAGIMRVPAVGGTPAVVIAAEAGELYYGPQLLPDGDTTLFTVASTAGVTRWDNAAIVVQSLSSGERHVVIGRGRHARYLPTGHIVYALGRQLFGVAYDAAAHKAMGEAVPLAEGMPLPTPYNDATGTAQYDVARDGTLVYVRSGPNRQRVSSLVIAARDGAVERLPLPDGPYVQPRVSPDGRQLAFERDEGEGAEIWIFDLEHGGAPRRLTFTGQNRFPVWSADGQYVAFQSNREGDLGIFRQHVEGQGDAERLTTPAKGESHVPESWSPDGEHLLFSVASGRSFALWDLNVATRDAAPVDNLRTTQATDTSFSPDGRWLTYMFADRFGPSDSPDRGLYIEPYPATGARFQLPKVGVDVHPTWSRDGRSLLFGDFLARFVAIDVQTAGGVRFGTPTPLPSLPPPAMVPTLPRGYDVLPDGRIVMLVPVPGVDPIATVELREIVVVQNWFEELERLAPTN